MQALCIRNLTKTYRNGVQALKGIDLDVDEGEFFALLFGLPMIGSLLGCTLVGAFWMCLVIFGFHWSLVPIALVNLSGNFYRSCQRLSEKAERNLVYALVNTLCALPPVDKVRFFIDGQTVDALVTSICLRSALLPNPGIVVK